ncbi:MAG: PAS domain-containing protein [Pseudomonadota bacterium]|nr:PAS domain-containing protein [Pseudomonadota bacterium]
MFYLQIALLTTALIATGTSLLLAVGTPFGNLSKLLTDTDNWTTALAILLLFFLLFILLYLSVRSILAHIERRSQQNTARFLTILENIPYACIVLTDDAIAYLNSQCASLLGQFTRPKPYIGMSYFDYIPPNSRHKVMELLQKLLTHKHGTWHRPLQLLCANRTIKTVIATISPIIYRGERSLLITMKQNDSWSKLLTRFETKQIQLTNFTNAINLTLFQINDRGVLIYLNAAWKKLSGLEPALSIGKLLANFIHPSERSEFTEIIRAINHGEKLYGVSKGRILHTSDIPRWVEWHIEGIRDFEGQTACIGYLIDITQRKNTEEILRNSRRTLSLLVNNLPGMVYRGRYDRSWTMEYISEGAFELTGYSPVDMINNTLISYNDLIHEKDRGKIWSEVETALEENRPFQLVYRIIRRDEIVQWVCEHGQGVYSINNDLLAIEGFIYPIDIQTAQKFLSSPETESS